MLSAQSIIGLKDRVANQARQLGSGNNDAVQNLVNEMTGGDPGISSEQYRQFQNYASHSNPNEYFKFISETKGISEKGITI